jgi:NPCBM/NEW2 domain
MLRVLLSVGFVLFASSILSAADVTDLNNKILRGQIVGLTADTLSIKDDGGAVVKLPLKSLATVDVGNKLAVLPMAYDEVELTDGSILRLQDFKIQGKKIVLDVAMTVEGSTKPKTTLPMMAVFTWLRNAPQGNNRNELRSIVLKRGTRDLLVTRAKVEEKDVLVPSEGTVLQGSEDGTKIDYNNNADVKTTLPIARFAGLVFNQANQAVVPPTIGKVIDVYGNTLVATSITTAEANGQIAVTVKTVAGAEYQYGSLNAIAKFDFSQGNQKFLSELEPTVDAAPVVDGDLNMPYLKNKTPNGGLRLGGKAYTKGVWVASDVALVYKLDGDYREFKAVLGIDEAVQVATGTLKVSIEADGKKLFEQTFTRKANKTETVNLNVKDAKVLKINVETDALFTGASLSLGDAKLQK